MIALETGAFTDRIKIQPLTFGMNLLVSCSVALAPLKRTPTCPLI